MDNGYTIKPLTVEERKSRTFQRLQARLGHGAFPERRKVGKDDVFRYLCEWQAAISPVPERIKSKREIADAFGATTYNVQKCLKELEADGLVKANHFGGMDEDGAVWCLHGFGLTKKGCDTDIYREIEQAEIEEMDEFLKKSHEEWLKEEAAKVGNR